MIRQKKYKLLEQLLKLKIKSNFTLESFSYNSKNKLLFLTKVASKILEEFFQKKKIKNRLKYPSFFNKDAEIKKKTFLIKKKVFFLTTFLNTKYFFDKIFVFYSIKKENNLNYFFTNSISIHV